MDVQRVELVRGGGWHEIGDRTVWSPLVAVCESGSDGPEARLGLELRNGVPEVREVLVRSVGTGRAVRATDLRLKLDDLIEDALAEAAFLHDDRTAEGWRDSPFARRELAANPHAFDDMIRPSGDDAERRSTKQQVQKARRRPRQKVTDEVLRQVADVYRANVNDRPTQAVRERFDLRPSTASLYVRRARDAGYLGPALNGKAGEQA